MIKVCKKPATATILRVAYNPPMLSQLSCHSSSPPRLSDSSSYLERTITVSSQNASPSARFANLQEATYSLTLSETAVASSGNSLYRQCNGSQFCSVNLNSTLKWACVFQSNSTRYSWLVDIPTMVNLLMMCTLGISEMIGWHGEIKCLIELMAWNS